LVAAPHDDGSCHCQQQKQQQQQQQKQQHELTKHFSREILHKPSARGSGKSENPIASQTADRRRSEKSQLFRCSPSVSRESSNRTDACPPRRVEFES